MANPELGTKRLCANCAAKFYDLNKTPIVCPKCSTVLVLATSTRVRPEAIAPTRAAALVDEAVVPETQAADFVSLEQADAEAQGKKPQGEAAIDDEEEDEIAIEVDDGAALIEEEGDEDVNDIIGDVSKDEDV